MTPSRRNQPSESSAKQEESALTEQVALLEARCAALDRRHEVLELLETATDPDDALERLQAKLGLEYPGALVVLDLQLRRLTSSERDRTAAELAEATARLREVRQQPGN